MKNTRRNFIANARNCKISEQKRRQFIWYNKFQLYCHNEARFNSSLLHHFNKKKKTIPITDNALHVLMLTYHHYFEMSINISTWRDIWIGVNNQMHIIGFRQDRSIHSKTLENENHSIYLFINFEMNLNANTSNGNRYRTFARTLTFWNVEFGMCYIKRMKKLIMKKERTEFT